jgi:hypothetical protein
MLLYIKKKNTYILMKTVGWVYYLVRYYDDDVYSYKLQTRVLKNCIICFHCSTIPVIDLSVTHQYHTPDTSFMHQTWNWRLYQHRDEHFSFVNMKPISAQRGPTRLQSKFGNFDRRVRRWDLAWRWKSLKISDL